VLCYDRRSGKQLWRTEVHRGKFVTKGNKKSSQASATPATDGKRLFINFLNDGAVYATALSLDGAQLWQKKISDFVVHQGFGASPAVYGSVVVFSADNKGGGAIAALDRATGDLVWRHPRPKLPNYTSPIPVKAGGRDQLVMIGCDLVSGFDPQSGSKLWEFSGATTECVTSTVTDGVRVFTSGGYPKNHVSAVRADGSGAVDWENTTRVYVPSMIAYQGRLYGVADAGIAFCWESATGKEVWKGRLSGTFSASLVRCGSDLTAVNETGHAFVFRADPNEFKLLANNQLGDEVFATPVYCGNRIYLRAATEKNGERKETLYCIGNGD
jgi:outer membrane protein assembly factor BamB